MNYVTVTAEELDHLRAGLQILESLNDYDDDRNTIYFYGLTTNSVLLDTVKEAVSYWANEEIAEQDVKVDQAVFIFPLSADILYYLTGSGVKMTSGEAVYSGGSEGPQEVSLKKSNMGGYKATVGQFATMALSKDEFNGHDFLLKYGTTAQQAQPQEVKRTEPAQEQTQKPVAAPAAAPAPAKKSSLNFDIEGWLR